ncbi:MAG TPA: hypothetical protein VJ827_02245 [Rubrobacter sp.]|nr:hypothetical protein [Rubrobacter sp.]
MRGRPPTRGVEEYRESMARIGHGVEGSAPEYSTAVRITPERWRGPAASPREDFARLPRPFVDLDPGRPLGYC